MFHTTQLYSTVAATRLLQEGTQEAPPDAPWLGVLAVLALVLLNGFFVATEFSMVTARRGRIEQLAAQGQRRASAVKSALGQIDKVIAATQLGITIASLGLGWVGEPAVANLLLPLFEALPMPDEWRGAGAHTVSFIISFSLITVLHILLGELVPKAMAIQKPESVALFVGVPMILFMQLFRPVVRLLSGMGNVVLRLIGIQGSAGHEEGIRSVEELRYIMTASRKAGVLEAGEGEIATRALTLGDLTARRVMVPRTELVTVPADAPIEEVFDLAASENHVRFPVHSSDVDHIIGILHLTDVVNWHSTQPGVPFSARAAMREALMVPESLEGDRLLAQMRKARTHTAIVVDEFGGVAGMVTLQDLLERIVGDLPEEFDDDRPEFRVMPDGSSVIAGLASVEDLRVRFNVELIEHEAETVGGYVMETLGRVPRVGDEIALGSYRLRVAEMDGQRVAEVVMSK